MKRAVTLLTMVACGILVSQGVRAELKSSDPFQFSVDLAAEYTDNRDSVPDDRTEETWDLLVRPRVDLLYHGERSLIDFYYMLAYRYRTDPSPIQNDNRLFHEVGFDSKFSASPRMELRFWDRFNYTDDPSVDDGGRTVRGDLSYILNRVEAGLIRRITRRSNLDFFVRNSMKRYDEEAAADSSDEDRTDAGIALWNQISRTLSLETRAMYSLFGYDDQFGLNRDFTAAFLGLGLEKMFNPQFRGGIKGGVNSVEYDDEGLDSQIIPYGELWVKGYTVPSTRLHASLAHSLRDADAYPFASQEYSEFRAGIEWDMTPRLTIDLEGVYRNAEYDADSLPTTFLDRLAMDPALAAFVTALEIQPDGDETTIEAEGGLTFHLTDKSDLRISQRYEDVDSDVGFSYEKNTTLLTLSKRF